MEISNFIHVFQYFLSILSTKKCPLILNEYFSYVTQYFRGLNFAGRFRFILLILENKKTIRRLIAIHFLSFLSNNMEALVCIFLIVAQYFIGDFIRTFVSAIDSICKKWFKVEFLVVFVCLSYIDFNSFKQVKLHIFSLIFFLFYNILVV